MPKIDVKHLKFSYKDKNDKNIISDVFLDFNAEFENKETSVILGQSGSGKSTLLNIIAGLRNDFGGEVTLDNKPIQETTMRDRDLAYLTQNIVLYPTMTIFENIAFPLKFTLLKQEEINYRVRKIAKDFGIEHTLARKPKYLSYGQQHRVVLAKALIKEPTLLLLDEPFTGLDPLIKEELMNILKQYIETHEVTVLYVTHDYYEALKMGKTIFVIKDGKIEFKGSSEELKDPFNPYLISLKETSEVKKEETNE